MNLFFVPAVLPVMITHFLLCQLRANYSLKHEAYNCSSFITTVCCRDRMCLWTSTPPQCRPSKEQFSKFHTFQKIEVENFICQQTRLLSDWFPSMWCPVSTPCILQWQGLGSEGTDRNNNEGRIPLITDAEADWVKQSLRLITRLLVQPLLLPLSPLWQARNV